MSVRLATNVRGLEAATKELWRHVRPKLRPGEELRIDTFDGMTLMAPLEDEWHVRASYFRTRDGLPIRSSFRHGRVALYPSRLANAETRYGSGGLMDSIVRELRYLVAITMPARPPAGWRLFGRAKRVQLRHVGLRRAFG